MTPSRITRNCLDCQGTGYYEIVRIVNTGNRIVRCPICGRTEELTQTDHTAPGSEYARPGKRSA